MQPSEKTPLPGPTRTPGPAPARAPASTGSDAIAALVDFFASNPGLPRTIMDQHRDDGTGHCTLCTAGMLTGLRRDTPGC
jgi:hypothetical protein